MDGKKWTVKTFCIRILKILAWSTLCLTILLIALVLIIQLPSVQSKIIQEAVSIAKTKLGVDISVKKIAIGFPKKILINELLVRDKTNDTLVYAGDIEVDTDLWELLHHTIDLKKITITGLRSHVTRTALDSSYNFDFIIKTFDSPALPADTTTSGWKFSLGHIILTNTQLRYHDGYDGNYVDLSIRSLNVTFDRFDIDKKSFHLTDVNISSVAAKILQTKISDSHAAANSQFSPDIALRKLTLDHISINYTQEALGQVLIANIDQATVSADKIDLRNHALILNRFLIRNSLISWQQMTTRLPVIPPPAVVQNKTPGHDVPWHFKLKELDLSGNTVQFHDFTKPILKDAFDYSHLWLQQLSVKAHDIAVENNKYHAVLEQFVVTEKNGFKITEFKALIDISEHRTGLENVVFKSTGSNFAFTAYGSYPSLAAIGTSWQKATFGLTMRPSSISLREVAWFSPALLSQFPPELPKSSFVKFSGVVKGRVDDVVIEHLYVSGLEKTRIQVSGSVRNLPDFKKALFSISIDTFATTSPDLLSVLPDSINLSSIRIPDWIGLKGTFTGTLRKPAVKVIIRSADGEVDFQGKLDRDSVKKETYEANMSLRHLEIGRIIKQDSIGILSMQASIKGAGFVLKQTAVSIDLLVSEFRYQGYTYENFKIRGSLIHDVLKGTASMRDKNLDFDLTAGYDGRSQIPTYDLKANLKTVDLNALHLTFRPLKARGILVAHIATRDFRVINGKVAVRNVAVFNGDQLYSIDSIAVSAADTKGQTNITIDSDLVTGFFQGTIHLVSLPAVLERHFNSYFALRDTAHSAPVDHQDFKFQLEIRKTAFVTDILLPSLRSFQASPITGNFNSASRQLDIHTELKKVQYDGLAVQDFVFDIKSTAKALDYSLSVNDFKYDSLKIPGMTFGGRVAHDSIKSTLTILDSLQKQKYLLGTVLTSLKNEFQFKFTPGKVFLNYHDWKVPDDNYLRFHQKTMQAHNFSISHDQEMIVFDTKEDVAETVTLGFREFDLENIFNIVSGGNSIVTGRLDGTLNVFLKKNNAFNAAIKIKNLTVVERAWGNLSLTAERISDDKFDVSVTVKGTNADILIKGDYLTTKPASLINLNVELNRIDMSLLEPFSEGQIKKSRGDIHGRLDVTGTLKHPLIRGDVVFKDVNFVSSYVNSSFSMKDETITFNGTEVVLNNFKVLDDNNNIAVLKGSIRTTNYRDYKLDLNVNTKNFRILNTTIANNPLYFGKVKMNATAKITGPLSLPVVDLQMGFSDDTEFTYIIPVSSKGVTSQKGIVEFVDKHVPKDSFLTSLHLKDTAQNFIRGFELTANVKLVDAQKFTIIVDPKSGDKLNVQGSTNLVVKIDPAGNMNLSGQYEISKGSYTFSFYKLVRRDFELLKGGTITWAGDPFDATFDLQALYKVETSPLELLAGASGSTDLNPYRQSFPFLVYLNIKGQISAPEISFKLDMPEANKSVLGGNVYSRIQDINASEPDLNKQVFSLLVLRRFMADDPFENQVTTSISSNARSSVSGLLTEQLNRLSKSIKGVQLTVDLKSFDDYTTGVPLNQTQLQLGVQKTLLHNKLVVKLAGNVDIAGQNTNQNSLTDYIGDLALEYKVNPDGTLRLTGFRNSDYDMIDGELIKTGAGVIYVKDFNAFRELFKPNVKDQQ